MRRVTVLFWSFGVLCLGAVLLLGSQALTQDSPAPPAPKAPKPAATTLAKPPVKKPSAAAQAKAAAKKPEEGAGAAPPVVMPDAEKILLLVRNTLITLNDALQTGNFTVLRDRAAPGFRAANTAARLGQAFADLASRGIDLSTVSVTTPQLTQAPSLDQEKGMLHVQGAFPTQPLPINFEILYQSVDGRWRLFGLAVQPVAPAPPASAPTANAAPPAGQPAGQ